MELLCICVCYHLFSYFGEEQKGILGCSYGFNVRLDQILENLVKSCVLHIQSLIMRTCKSDLDSMNL